MEMCLWILDTDEMKTTEAADKAVDATELALPQIQKSMASQQRARTAHEDAPAGSDGSDGMDVSG